MQATRDIQDHPDTIRRGGTHDDPRVSARRLSVLLMAASLIGPSSAIAQIAAPAPPATAQPAPSPEAIKQRGQELEATREQQKKAAELQQKLKADIAVIGQDRSKLNQQLINIAAQVRGVETRIAEAEAGLRPLNSREQQ